MAWLLQAVREYVDASASKSDLDRTATGSKRKTGADTGAVAIHPLSGDKVKHSIEKLKACTAKCVIWSSGGGGGGWHAFYPRYPFRFFDFSIFLCLDVAGSLYRPVLSVLMNMSCGRRSLYSLGRCLCGRRTTCWEATAPGR